MRQADVALRLSPPRQPDLIQRHLKTIKFHLYAAPSYLKRAGVPRSPADLIDHQLVVYGEAVHPPFPNVTWLLDVATRPRGSTAERRGGKECRSTCSSRWWP